MEPVFLIIASITSLYLFFLIIESHWGFKNIKNLSDQAACEPEHLPFISIVLSALNEENNIEGVVNSLVNLDYPNLEIILINDRSTDKTGDILERLKSNHSKINVFHIKELPEGWFGKNHALDFGSKKALGEWILFTDADVKMKPDTLLKAMSYALEHNLDHLTIHENHYRESFWLKVLLLGYNFTYCLRVKPWRIRYSWSKRNLGRGAFNLIRKDSYQKTGGHRAIALECLDDLKIGELIKTKGFRQDVVNAQDHVDFKWYGTLRDMIAGLEKNGFAFFNYRILPTIHAIFFAFLFFVWPCFAIFIYTGWVQWINILNVCLCFYFSLLVAREFRLPITCSFFYPIAVLLLLYSVFNSMISIYRNQGVVWRGTHYSLKTLRKE